MDGAHHQGPGVQARLVFRALVVLPAQSDDGAVIPPQKSHEYYVNGPSKYCHTPSRISLSIEGRDPDDELMRHLYRLSNVDWNQNGAAQHS